MQQAEIEKKILDFWTKDNTFKKSLEKKSRKGEYVFYDGPPFATGTPHYGHIVASLMKDMIPRYATMRGFRVERKWGWDCHGLPIENIVEQEHNFRHKKDILTYGVDKFNEDARSKVMKYAREWRTVIERLGRWVDMDNDYKTMDLHFMESIWWVFKELYEKDLLYEAYRSMHICPRCETTLAQSEVAQGYKEVKDLSVVVKFKITKEALSGSLLGSLPVVRLEDLPSGNKDSINTDSVNSSSVENKSRSDGGPEGNRTPQGEMANPPSTPVAGPYHQDRYDELYHDIYLLAWTTTPWTLPGNMALAVGKDIKYAIIKFNDGLFILAKDRVDDVFRDKEFETIREIQGSELVDLEYEPLFPYYDNDKLEGRENAFKVYAGNEFVNTEEGTGIVHIAPAFGADDYGLSNQHKIPFVQHVHMDGTFKDEVTDFAGMPAKHQDEPNTKDHPEDKIEATDVKIVKYLARAGTLFSKEKFTHTYPHCWRCDSPLLNYSTSSWFVAVEKIKKDLLKNAKKIEWMPEHIKEGRFGQWLEGARDWSISRQRFWGSVLPIWKCEKDEKHIKVIGSVKELEELSGQTVQDLHKHFVDEITFTCEECNATMRRIPDVLDCWFESGSMPYAQQHHPFENEKKFKENFPAEFIAEGVDQTRAWFYYLHVLATALKKKPAFKHVVANGIVLAEDGLKMSKRLNNYPDPLEMFNTYGADAVRYYLASSPVMRAEDLRFSEKEVDEVVKKVLLILNNVLSFYKMYADDSIAPKAHTTHVLDAWISAKTNQLVKNITEAYEAYDLNRATRPIAEFINELSTWYLRRSRERIKDGDTEALATLKWSLGQLALVVAPVMPFTAENLWKELGNTSSVHLEDWPKAKKVSSSIVEEMGKVREVVEHGLSARAEIGIKIRQPLIKATIKSLELEKNYEELVKDELNVKSLSYEKGDSIEVMLDTKISSELATEGNLRELVRAINALRKKEGLTPGDTVTLLYSTESDELKKVFEQFSDELKKSVIASKVVEEENDGEEIDINSEKTTISIKK